MVFQWDAHRKHREQVIRDQGEWIGLVDEDGVPLFDLPLPMEFTAPSTHLNPESLSMTLPTRMPSGEQHPVMAQLIADGLGASDTEGRLQPVSGPSRFIVIEHSKRQVFRVGFARAQGEAGSPSALEIGAVDLLNALDGLPCFSIPGLVKPEWKQAAGDYGAQFKKPRRLSMLKMAQVADGYSVEGPAEETMRRLIKESLDALHRVFGITEDFPYAVSSQSSGKPSPHVIIRPQDRSLLEELTPICQMAGCSLHASLWWPGDPQPPGLELTMPTIVFAVMQR